jgi:hypothetical protein
MVVCIAAKTIVFMVTAIVSNSATSEMTIFDNSSIANSLQMVPNCLSSSDSTSVVVVICYFVVTHSLQVGNCFVAIDSYSDFLLHFDNCCDLPPHHSPSNGHCC